MSVVRPGTVPYPTAWDWQRRLASARADGSLARDLVFLLEHPPVYTLGRRADRSNVLFDDATLRQRGIEVVPVDRGGDVTYHGPGQLVGYPILRLSGMRVVDYVRALEEILIRALADVGVTGERSTGYTGVWVGDQKVAAIGVRVSSGRVTTHGFALNVHPDLADFTGIVPCGISDRGVCSLASLGVDVTVADMADRVEAAMAEVLGATLEPASLDALSPLSSKVAS
ncbi:lipoyl(octanoyl) transferase LipB [Egicoccus sp. AB-alg2]|uniref:lipoyl(octanoyl) transferase LipB n=1 Tax=Egicoccus sp. AB-alg2 TaxID=3242693 RepID=UPI00359D925D